MNPKSNGHILLAHGAGGRLTHELIGTVFLKYLKNPVLDALDDAAELTLPVGRIAFTTDAFVVQPLFFPGGDIGKLAVCGTVNDLAMKGARALALSSAVILEEGLETMVVERVVRSMQEAARQAGVSIVCGDTKVVEKGSCDQIFIATAGIGVVRTPHSISGSGARPKDAILVSGTIGDHGTAVLQARGEYELSGRIQSDCAPLGELVERLLEAAPNVRVLRDPTRGGLATTLNEIAQASRVHLEIREESIPIDPAVKAACDLLGLDPFYVANEGKLVAFVPEEEAESALAALRSHPLGRAAARIGRAEEGKPGVTLWTRIGGRRPLRILEGDQLPRIC